MVTKMGLSESHDRNLVWMMGIVMLANACFVLSEVAKECTSQQSLYISTDQVSLTNSSIRVLKLSVYLQRDVSYNPFSSQTNVCGMGKPHLLIITKKSSDDRPSRYKYMRKAKDGALDCWFFRMCASRLLIDECFTEWVVVYLVSVYFLEMWFALKCGMRWIL